MLFLGKAMKSRMEFWSVHHGAEAVEAERCRRGAAPYSKAPIRNPTGLLLRGEAQQLEVALLQGAVVDTNGATADLDAVDHQVIGVGPQGRSSFVIAAEHAGYVLLLGR